MLFTKIYFFLFTLWEEAKVRFLFYKNPLCKLVDQALKKAYKGTSSYHIAKMYLENQGAKDLYTYGETPLSSLYKALKKCEFATGDVFLDLGSGTGRTVLFACSFFGLHGVGIERVPLFVNLAQDIADKFAIPAKFLQQDILQADLTQANIIYLCPLLLEENILQKLTEKLLFIDHKTTILTIQLPLSLYSDQFDFTCIGELSFPWGKNFLYRNYKKNLHIR